MEIEEARRDAGISSGALQTVTPLPSLGTIYFYLTEGCNLRCRHCWLAPPHETSRRQYAALDTGLFRKIIGEAKPLGLTSVKLTGGEPLMHPQIVEILEILRNEKIGLTMETNGVLCSPEMARELARSRIAHISVSIDGADAATHEWVRGVEGCFEAALEGIRSLVGVGIRPQLIMTLMRKNVDQAESVVRLADTLGCSSVKFNVVQPTARGEKMYEGGEALGIRELL
jgi:SynChlorMet cassette radical SAM/SPASM protein ScmF